MKKFFSVLLAVAIFLSSFSSAYAVDMKRTLESIKNIQQEYLTLKKQNVNLRDFEFLLGMTIVQFSAWNKQVGSPNIKKEKITKISENFVAIISAQYISMQQYLQRYVIEKSSNKEQMKKKCSKLSQYIEDGIVALR